MSRPQKNQIPTLSSIQFSPKTPKIRHFCPLQAHRPSLGYRAFSSIIQSCQPLILPRPRSGESDHIRFRGHRRKRGYRHDDDRSRSLGKAQALLPGNDHRAKARARFACQEQPTRKRARGTPLIGDHEESQSANPPACYARKPEMPLKYSHRIFASMPMFCRLWGYTARLGSAFPVGECSIRIASVESR